MGWIVALADAEGWMSGEHECTFNLRKQIVSAFSRNQRILLLQVNTMKEYNFNENSTNFKKKMGPWDMPFQIPFSVTLIPSISFFQGFKKLHPSSQARWLIPATGIPLYWVAVTICVGLAAPLQSPRKGIVRSSRTFFNLTKLGI